MANTRLRFSGQSALDAYALIRDIDDLIWNGTTLVTEVAASQETYAVDVPEIGDGGYYATDVPADLPVGKYHVTYKARNTVGTAAESDDVIFQAVIEWDGTAIVDDLIVGASKADICNLALSHLSVGTEISNLETDTSAQAETCRRFYDTALYECLRDFAWPFAIRSGALSQIETDPTEEWGYSYRYPVNCLYLIKIFGSVRNPGQDTRIPFRIVGDDTGQVIYTDEPEAEIEYVAKATNPTRYPPDFTMALSLRLAVLIAPRLAGSHPKLRQEAAQLYEIEMRRAAANAANESRREPLPEAEMIRGRE